MMRALYEPPANERPNRKEGNTGLWYDKYCDAWPIKNGTVEWSLKNYKQGKDEFNPKQDWIDTVTGKVGNEALIAEYCLRQRDMANEIWGIKLPQLFKTDWRFVTGLGREHPVENGFAWHHTLGTPYLPGSSVKGMVRAWAEHWLEEESEFFQSNKAETISRIFGPRGAGQVGGVIFFDALPTGPVRLEADIMTPHYGPYYSEGKTPGDWHNPVPIPFLTVAKDTTFQFIVAPRRPYEPQDKQDVETVRKWLKDALEWIGAGAKTAVGYGRMAALGEEETNDFLSNITAASNKCDWVDQQIADIVQRAHCQPDEALRGKALAQAWSQLGDEELKQKALADIRSRWQSKGWGDAPQGRSAQQARRIYDGEA